MDRRRLLTAGGASIGALALGAVVGGTTADASTGGGNPTRTEKAHLKTFDELDFDVFSNQKWGRLHESHAKDVRVHWPDGHFTDGIDTHVSDLKGLFVYAPDTNIKVHPHRLAMGELTAVTGVMKGTFTRPMTMPDGQVIQPNGKKFELPMATVGHWRGGVMNEEWLYWDNATYYTQLGLT
jgi:hypothetical protein